ncbi:MAG: transposase [Candidatus Sumerlaeota bacterium]
MSLRWRSCGQVPHFDGVKCVEHLTFHLADSVPDEMLNRFHEELESVPISKRATELWSDVQEWADGSHGCCYFRDPRAALAVQNVLLLCDGERCLLFAWMIMPNHVHVFIQPQGEWTSAKLIADCKEQCLEQLVKVDGLQIDRGACWQEEYWESFLRDEAQFKQAVERVHNDPVRAGLVERACDWPWSSASLMENAE